MNKKAAFVFGRFQPITKGHGLLFDKLKEHADRTPFIFMSHTQDNIRNPLYWTEKVVYVGEAYPGIEICGDETVRSPYHALEYLADLGYTDIIFVVGQDRIDDFQTMHNYTEKFGISNLEIVSAGWRDPTADDITGVSGSKMREYVREEKLFDFLNNIPESIPSHMSALLFIKLTERLKVGVNNVS